ncbi:MAG TPA: hypothetical protein VMT36_05910 [Candidatus Saccharimonadia bacterium]|nr:hypothetical protein [Candidatus Saccharimonadia bacterium]
MREARPWVRLAIVTIALGGCALGLQPKMPAAVSAYLEDAGMTFTAQEPPAAVGRAEDVVAAVQNTSGADRLAGLEAVPFFGVLRCTSEGSCRPGPAALVGMNERTVWILFYPDLADVDRGRTGGWIIIDALTSLKSGFEIFTP